MRNKRRSDRFDVGNKETNSDDELFSTEMSDMETNMVYRHYKTMKHEAKVTREDMEAKELQIKLALEQQEKGMQTGETRSEPWMRQLDKLNERIFNRK